LEKQRLKYGRAIVTVRLAVASNTKRESRREAWMGKSDRKKPVKKTVPKPSAKAGLNGRGTTVATRHIAKSVVAKPARKMRARRSTIILPDGYRPSESEPFMNERHRIYFRNKLVAWKEEIIRQNRETLHVLHEDSSQHADLADRATSETDRALELRARDRQRKLVAKIDAALARIEDGSYGFCEDTGEPIGLKRLDARPIATLSLEAQEAHERREKVFRED
jgi:DnaK suppressor protein